jgi:hypothetical protein
MRHKPGLLTTEMSRPHDTKSGTRKPKSPAERAAWESLEQHGFVVTKRGWPDFWAFSESSGGLMVVEVKPNGAQRLKKAQQKVMQLLADHGVICLTYTPQEGFKDFVGE